MKISKTFSLEAMPLLCEGVDIKSLNMTSEEGFILSRLDGQVRVRHLVTMTGLGEEQTLEIIQGLSEKGIIILHEPKDKSADGKEGSASGGVRLVIDPKSIPTGKEFENFVGRLLNVIDRTDYFQLLGLTDKASLAEVKKSYRRLSKIFHPDQYFRKVEPAFRRQLQQVFKSINIAYQVLNDDERRAEYAKQLKEKGVVGAVEELRLEVKQKVYTGPKLKLGLTMDKEKAKDEKLKRMFASVKNHPLQEQMQKTERLFQLAQEEIRKKNFKSARTNLKLAIQLDPTGGKKYQEELVKIDQIENDAQGDRMFEEGNAAEKTGDFQKAGRCYAEALKISPNNPKYIFSHANIMVKYTSNFERGRGLLLKLMEMDNKNPEYFYLLGLAYKGLGQKRAAEVQLQKALELNPKHKDAQKELKSLK
jgi:curved DNA-binding protein CbpA